MFTYQLAKIKKKKKKHIHKLITSLNKDVAN